MQKLYLYKTKLKIKIAQLIYPFIKIITRKDKLQIKRDGIFFEVDLTEGIDLNLFLFGGFQQHIIESRTY